MKWYFAPKKSAFKFVALSLRWIVERTFSWIEAYRRMTIDYERNSESAEAMLHLSFYQILPNDFRVTKTIYGYVFNYMIDVQ